MAFLAFNDGLGGTTNLLLRSEEFDNAAWTKTTGCTVTPNIATDPTGANTGDTISYDGSGTSGSFRIFQMAQAPLSTVGAGVVFTMSVWLRAPSPLTVLLGNNHGNFTTCALTTTWQRFSVTGTGTGALSGQLLIYSPVAVNTAFTMYAWGAQAEVGIAPSAYVPTTSATATAASLRNDYIGTPASRFTGWTQSSPPFGDSVNVLADGALVMVKYRTDYGASFDLADIPVKAQSDGVNYVDIADRLIAWLMQGGKVSVQTGDSNATIYPTCGLYPGTTPTLRLSDRRLLLYTLSLKLADQSASPHRMSCVYAP